MRLQALSLLEGCVLCDVLLQPLLPLLFRPAAPDTLLLNTVEEYRRRDMGSDDPIRLDHLLHIIRNLIPRVQCPIFTWLITNLQYLKNLPFINTFDLPRQLRQTLVSIIPRLIHDIDIKIFFLVIEQQFREIPELCRCKSQDSGAGFVDECG